MSKFLMKFGVVLTVLLFVFIVSYRLFLLSFAVMIENESDYKIINYDKKVGVTINVFEDLKINEDLYNKFGNCEIKDIGYVCDNVNIFEYVVNRNEDLEYVSDYFSDKSVVDSVYNYFNNREDGFLLIFKSNSYLKSLFYSKFLVSDIGNNNNYVLYEGDIRGISVYDKLIFEYNGKTYIAYLENISSLEFIEGVAL